MKNIFIVLMYLLSICAPAQAQVNKTILGAITPNLSTVANYVQNSGYEVNTKTGIEDTSTIVTRNTSSPLFGKADFQIHATAINQVVKFDTVSFDSGVSGNCEAYFSISGDASQYQTYVETSAGAAITVPFQLQNYTLAQYSANPKPIISIPVQCSSGSKVVIKSLAAGAAIDVDNVANGLPVHFGAGQGQGQVPQYLGEALWPPATSCAWSVTNVLPTFANFPVNSNCNNPTISGNGISAPGTKIPAIVVSPFGPGDIEIVVAGNIGVNGTTGGRSGYYRVTDGTKFSNAESNYNSAGDVSYPVFIYHFHYDSAQSSAITYTIQGGVGGSGTTASIYNSDTSTNTFVMSVKFFPANANQGVIFTSYPTLPTYTRLTSSSGNYTVPAGIKFLRIKTVGGGGGGGGSGTASLGAGTAGGATTFGTSLLSAGGGAGGAGPSNGGGSGGNPSVSSPAIQIDSFSGGNGNSGQAAATGINAMGGSGGNSPLGGGGASGYGTNTGPSGTANTGGGGGGAGGGGTAALVGGPGGGAGAYIYSQINNPVAGSTYAYCIGNSGAACAGGAGGIAGTSGQAGGAGGTGYIEIEENYIGTGSTSIITTPPTVSIVTASSHSGGFSANGTGTYTTPPGAKYIIVKAVGGGGGGSSSGTASTNNGSNGGATTFGTSLLSAGFGSGGAVLGGAGGTPSITSPAFDLGSFGGGAGGARSDQASGISEASGYGASSFFGGGGASVLTTSAGGAAVANTGSGGGGAGLAAGVGTIGAGGGAGAFILAQINLPTSTYSYTVGASGAGGTAGTSGAAGGAGASGEIIVTEYY